jgi:hypothetical protein
MPLIRCVECKHFEPDPASLRTGRCSHQEPWDGSEMQFARDEHECANYLSLGGSRHLSPEEEEKYKKTSHY